MSIFFRTGRLMCRLHLSLSFLHLSLFSFCHVSSMARLFNTLLVVAQVALAAGQLARQAPWGPGCTIGEGYSLDRGCLGSALIRPDLCSSGVYDNSRVNRACIQRNLTRQDRTIHTTTLKDSRDHSEMMETTATAQGRAFGVSVSSSVGYMESRSISENSINFILGDTIGNSHHLLQSPSCSRSHLFRVFLQLSVFRSLASFKILHGTRCPTLKKCV
jgi:hypothetical protein